MSSIEIKPRQFIGYLLVIFGLMLLGYVIFMGNGLFSGTIQVIEVGGDKIYPETSIFLGVILQIGILAILTFASTILLKYGINISMKTGE